MGVIWEQHLNLSGCYLGAAPEVGVIWEQHLKWLHAVISLKRGTMALRHAMLHGLVLRWY